MTPLREAAQQALEALQKIYIAPEHEEYINVWWPACRDAIPALRAALAEPQTHNSAECYKLHHDCAVAEVERLRLLCEEMLSELYVYRASKQLKDVTAAIRARKENP